MPPQDPELWRAHGMELLGPPLNVRLDRWYNQGYTFDMKTAISVPDSIYEAAENLAQRLGMSRSQLYTTAVTRFLESFQDETVTQALNEIYSESDASVDPILWQMQLHALPEEEW